jgi:hypothetical protein
MLKWLAENYDISRQTDEDFIYIYLHDTTHINYEAIRYMNNFLAFAGIDLRDGCLCVRILKSEL